MKTKIPVVEIGAPEPICPHCDKEVKAICARQLESVWGVRYLYYCAACRKVLGI